MMLPNPDEFLRALGREIASLRGVNNLPPEIKERLYASLIPLDLLYTYEVDPTTLLNREGHRAFQFDFPPDQGMERKGLHLPRRDLPPSKMTRRKEDSSRQTSGFMIGNICSKRQIPSTCPRLAGRDFAQAGPITNKFPCLPAGRNDRDSK